jgi:hypothetical protein
MFDPLGLLSPVTVRAKIILQQIWEEKFDWDTQLPANVQKRWSNLAADLTTLSTTQCRRCYFPGADEKIRQADDHSHTTLHVFVDASQSSYGAAAYLSNGQNSSLIIAKKTHKFLSLVRQSDCFTLVINS